MANPLIPQGTLNRILGTFQCTANPQLNIAAYNLGKAAISVAFNGDTATMIPTLTGAAQSGEPYVLVTVTLHVLKTQALAASYITQIQTNTNIGDCTVKLDSTVYPKLDLTNCAIVGLDGLDTAGTNVEVPIRVTGTWIINNNLWS